MTSKRGPGNPQGPTTGSGRKQGDDEDWGNELIVSDDDLLPDLDGAPAEWGVGREAATDSQYISDDDLSGTAAAAHAAQQPANGLVPPAAPSAGRGYYSHVGEVEELTDPSRPISSYRQDSGEYGEAMRMPDQPAAAAGLEDPRDWTDELEIADDSILEEPSSALGWSVEPGFLDAPAQAQHEVSPVAPALRFQDEEEQALESEAMETPAPVTPREPSIPPREPSIPPREPSIPPRAPSTPPRAPSSPPRRQSSPRLTEERSPREEPLRSMPQVQAAPEPHADPKPPRSMPPPPFASPSMMPPLKDYDAEAPALASYQAFRTETHRLARTRDYRSIAGLHESALTKASWADTEEIVSNLLLDLARLYRDRLSDRDRARDTFERIVAKRPGHREAMTFLAQTYEAQGDMRALHELYARAVDDEWSPDRRVELTRNAARIALDHIGDAALAASDWERLLELGDMDGQVTVELSQVYREAGRWADLGEFLRNRSVACAATTRVAILREAAEAHLSGAHDPGSAEVLLNQILQDNPDDPIALASLANVRAHQKQWEELEAVARRPMTDVPSAARLDVLRMAAELLAAAGEHDRAAFAYERILNAAPADKEAVAAREAHLRRKGDHQGLVAFLMSRAEKARTADERAQLYQRAAEVADGELGDADMAAELWQKSVSAKPENATAYNALVALYDRLENIEGVTQALEGLASITKDSKKRAAVLRRLGEHYAYRADNDDRAQHCWLEVAAILPDDLAIQRELNGIHRRRGDFAGLDAALTRQMWRTTEPAHAVELAHEVATNLDENLSQPAKTVRAWIHVLDLAPDTDDALTVLSDKLQARAETTEVQGVLETRLSRARASGDDTTKIDIALQLADNWEQRGDPLAAIAAYERVRAWAPTDDRVLHALVRLYGKDNPGSAVSALEIAASREADPDRSRELLSRVLPLLPDNQARARFFLLHRLLRFDATSGLGEVVEAATSAEAWKELAALYERLAETTTVPELRRTFRLHLARVCEEHLGDSNRAFLALQSLALNTPRTDDQDALARLAEATGRWEDLLCVLDAALAGEPARDLRQSLLEHRAGICETHLKDPRRAFLELQRLIEGCVSGDPDDAEARALEQMHRLATAHGLLHELEAVHGELWDRAPDDDARVRAARARQCLRRDHLQDPAGALEQALLVLRLRPTDQTVEREVMEASEALGLWARTLPVLEGVWRAQGDDAARLVQLATLYRDKCASTTRAAELLCEALRLAPDHAEALELLDQLAVDGALWPRVVLATRLAAARTAGTERGLTLAQRVASLYADKLTDNDASLEVHRWILQVWPDNTDALERVIDAHRQALEHTDLRARLEQWIDRVADTSRHVERWLEVGRICRDYLDDPAGAMLAYSNVLDLDPSNDEAIEAMRSLGDVSLPIALRRKQVRVELTRATGTRRAELLTRLADIEEEMGEADAAIDALRELFSLESGAGAAGQRLAQALREHGRWEELATLEEEAATKAEDLDEQRAHLHAALRVSEDHLTDEARQERLLRKVLELAPSENDAFASLARLLRRAERHQDLAGELRRRLEEHADGYSHIERRWMRRELVRLLQLTLDNTADAEAVLRAGLEGKPDEDDALWLAMMAYGRSDHAAYLEQRRRHLPKLPARAGALVLCHLAEYCDEHMKTKGRVLALYREARTLDPNNTIASDALRGLGRGVKTWRATASLLAADDELSLTDAERSRRLVAQGDAVRSEDFTAALGWYERAVAVNPDNVGAWDALMSLAIERRDYEAAYLAALEGVNAYERVIPRGSVDEIATHAQRLAKTGGVAGMFDKVEDARALASVAFALDPDVPSAAILVADTRYELGAAEDAAALYSQVLDRLDGSLGGLERAHVLHRRGSTHLSRGDLDGANADLRRALENEPLFPQALHAMAEVLRKRGQPVNAALHELKALLVTKDTEKRGAICRRIGDLCDRDLQRANEAGAWYELAVEAGVEDKVLMNRLLQHYHRTGRTQQALVAIGELIETTADPMELAELWATRGSILAEHDLDSAEEALDIALSFNPAHPAALDKLREVLEGRGDYEQLAALLDARAESGTAAQRADAYRTLARMCFENLGDFPRGETYLHLLIELEPSRDALEQLYAIVQDDPAREDEKLPLLSRLLGTGGPFCDRLVTAARLIYDLGNRHWTWAALSALMGAAPVDQWTKGALVELRREFERFDSLNLLHPRLLHSIGALPEPDAFQAALSDLSARVFLANDEDAGATVDGRTGPGKVFDRVVEQLGLQAKLVRAPDSAEPAGVLSGQVPTVAIRTDLLAASPGELAYIYVRGILLARPACIALASVPEGDRARLLPALAAALNLGESPDDSRVQALADTFASVLSPAELEAWREHVSDLAAAEKQAAALFEAVELAATRVATVAAGDTRTAVRALARISLDNKRPPGVARLEDFEAFFDSIPAIAAVLSFVTSEEFAAALPGA